MTKGDTVTEDSFHASLDRALANTVSEPVFCEAILYHRTQYSPEEYCENPAVEGFELCERHLADEVEFVEPSDRPERWTDWGF